VTKLKGLKAMNLLKEASLPELVELLADCLPAGILANSHD